MKNKAKLSGVWLTCPCGKQFYRWRSKAARSHACSKECQYKFARRPSGLVYEIVAANVGWFKSDDARRFCSPKGRTPTNFKGDEVGYSGVHDWIKYHYGPAIKCEHCGKNTGRIHWANRSWEYRRDISDWMQLCPKCHQKYDRAGGWGLATERFPNELKRARR